MGAIINFLNILTKKPQLFSRGSYHKYGGLERIRTAVDGFADRCLASRPQDHFVVQSYKIFSLYQVVMHFFGISDFFIPVNHI
jgi:hypothetical protein